MNKSFAYRLAEAMADQGLTQLQLAEHTRKSQATVSRWLAGSSPRKQTAALLAKVLKVDIAWLMEGTGDKTKGGFSTWMDGIDYKTVKVASEAELLRLTRQKASEAETKFPSRLRWLRKNFAMSINQMAKRCGCDPSYISRLENASRKRPSSRFVESVITAFPMVRREWLWWGSGSPLIVPDNVHGKERLDEDSLNLLRQVNESAMESELRKTIEAIAADLKSGTEGLMVFGRMIKGDTSLSPDLRSKILDMITSVVVRQLTEEPEGPAKSKEQK